MILFGRVSKPSNILLLRDEQICCVHVCDRGSKQMLGLILTIFAHSAKSQFKLLKSF